MGNDYRCMSKSFRLIDNKLILIFDELEADDEHITKKINDKSSFYNTFYFKKGDIYQEYDTEVEEFNHPIFEIGVVESNYVKLKKDVFNINKNFYFDKEINFQTQKFYKNFYKYPNTSIIKTIINYVQDSVYIDLDKNFKDEKGHIPFSIYKHLIDKYPSKYEMDYYKSKQICSILSDYFDTKDYDSILRKIKDKQLKLDQDEIEKITSSFQSAGSIDLPKNQALLTEIKKLINSKLDEKEWQKILLPYIKLLYPKYIYAIDEIEINDTNACQRRIDYILIDYDCNIDIIELKIPSIQLLRKYTYRDNYIESKDLSGAIMQCEKYIYYLTSNKLKMEDKINNKIFEKTGKKFNVKINHPKAIVIAGRSSEFSDSTQIEDFQVIKRKYSNLVDIVTYDDLINRLNNLIITSK